MYGIPIAVQTRVMLLALGLGFLVGILYDVFRILRLSISRGRTAVFVQDVLFLLIFAAVTFAFCLSRTGGEVRFYIIFAEAMGFFIYYISFGAFVIRVSERIITAVRNTFEFIVRLISFPVRLVLRLLSRVYHFFVKTGQKNGKIFGKKLKFLLQRNRLLLYNTFCKDFKLKKKETKGT